MFKIFKKNNINKDILIDKSTNRICDFIYENLFLLLKNYSKLFSDKLNINITPYKNTNEILSNKIISFKKTFSIDISYGNIDYIKYLKEYNNDIQRIINYLYKYDLHFLDYQLKTIQGSNKFEPYGIIIWFENEDIEFKHLTKKELRKKKLNKIKKI